MSRAAASQVLLLDEITVDMDVVGRLDLLAFFQQECEERGATIMYATHIFDGLEPWITHVAHISAGKLIRGTKDLFCMSSYDCLAAPLSVLETRSVMRHVSIDLHTPREHAQHHGAEGLWQLMCRREGSGDDRTTQ